MATPAYLNALVAWALKTSQKSGIVYTPICNGGTSFPGAAGLTGNDSFYINIIHDTSENKWRSDFLSIITNQKVQVSDSAFLPEMAAQHVAGYTYYFQMKKVHEYIKNRVEANGRSIVNNCGLLGSFKKAFASLVANPASKIHPWAAFRRMVYEKAWQY